MSVVRETHLGVTVVDHCTTVAEFTGAYTLGAGGQRYDFQLVVRRVRRRRRGLHDSRQRRPLFTGHRLALGRKIFKFLQAQSGHLVRKTFGLNNSPSL